MAKKMIVKGVGSFMAKKYSADGKGVEVITLGSLQNLKIDLNVQLEDIFGGDGLFAIDTLVKSKSIEITATDAKFDLDQLQLMMGSTVQEGIADKLWVLGEQNVAVTDSLGAGPGIAVSSVPVAFGDTLSGDGNFSVRLKDSNRLLKKVATSTITAPGADEFFVAAVPADATAVPPVPASNKIVLAAANVGADVIYNYQRTATVDLVNILVDEVPFPVHVIHHGSFLQKDGTYQGIETELYQCRAKGNFTIDAQRATASTAAVDLQVLDPERADRKLGSIKRYSVVGNKNL